jgi:hypothetical protein
MKLGKADIVFMSQERELVSCFFCCDATPFSESVFKVAKILRQKLGKERLR